MTTLDLGWARLALLPSRAYSVNAASASPVIGLAFERQRGVHAIGGERRQDFDAWPGDLACTSAGLDIFSESDHGGEYLTLHLVRPAGEVLGTDLAMPRPRSVRQGDRRATLCGRQLRRLMLAPTPDTPALAGELAAMLVARAWPGERSERRGTRPLDRRAHGRVMSHIEEALDGPLGLDEMARLAGMPLLRFLRSFTEATGSTPHAYVTERRLQRARALLRGTDEPLAAIATECGFAHQSHLGSVMRRQLGLTPAQYRAQGR